LIAMTAVPMAPTTRTTRSTVKSIGSEATPDAYRAPMRRRALALVLLLGLPLAACGDDDDGGGDASTSTTGSTSTTSTTAASTTSTTAADEAAVSPSTAGIEVGGSVFAFGTPGGEVVDAVSAVLGDPTDESDIAECPAGPATGARWDGEIQLVLQEGAFVGWSMAATSALTLADGLAIGSTLQDVRDRYADVTVDPESTLGIELYSESAGLSGLVTEDSPTGTVDALWAGIVCIFR
jgi:hypothetical protein